MGMEKEIGAFKVAGVVLLSLVVTVLAYASIVSFGASVIYGGEDTVSAAFKYTNGVNSDGGLTTRFAAMQTRNDSNVTLLNIFAGVVSTILGLFSLAILLLVLKSFTGAGSDSGSSKGSF